LGEAYRLRLDRARDAAAVFERWSRALSWARLAVAVAGVGCAIAIVARAARPPFWALAGAALAAVAFAVLAAVHARVLRRLERERELAAIQEDALARLERDWSQAPLPSAPEPPEGSAAALARDLDLFGRASLFQLLGTAWTPPGRRTLARWLLAAAAPDTEGSTAGGGPRRAATGDPGTAAATVQRSASAEEPTPAEVRRRQEAVRELAPRLDERQELERAARRLGESEPHLERFLAWCEGGRWPLTRPGWAWASRLLPLPAAGGLAAAIFGLVPWSVPLLFLLLNWSLVVGLRRRLEAAFAEVDVGAADALAYAGTLRIAGGIADAGTAPRLRELAVAMSAGDDPAWRWMARLRRHLEIADSRHGSFHFIPQTLFLWDLHALRRLDRWRAAAGGRARRWLTALGELEALTALAGLAHDESAWAFPEIGRGENQPPADGSDGASADLGRAGEAGPGVEAAAAKTGPVATEGTLGGAAPAFRAGALGHPLLPGASRVANDVTAGPPGTFLLVTGSNMAGKSTLLRAIGVNAVLALAGGPACAGSLSLPPLRLATSMRTDDSLTAGVSRFMAEALRIRAVVAAAEAARRDGRGLLYLLDEALAGTNARERQAALRRVLARLLATGAIGAVAGHDLELAATPDLAAAARPVHFRETLHPRAEGGPRMTFDYRLRPGLATTSNALELMELLGLGSEPPPGDEAEEDRP